MSLPWWVAEKLLMTAQAAGLPGAVYRPSLVVGHSQTGAWHGNDIVAKMLRTWIELGMAPDVDVALDLRGGLDAIETFAAGGPDR